jgi:hypothetical protein
MDAHPVQKKNIWGAPGKDIDVFHPESFPGEVWGAPGKDTDVFHPESFPGEVWGAPAKDIDVFHPESSPRPPLGELWIKDSLLQLPQIDSCP